MRVSSATSAVEKLADNKVNRAKMAANVPLEDLALVALPIETSVRFIMRCSPY
jgi:hypothetical protein